MLHGTCCAHGLYRIAEEICGQFGTVDELISNMKKKYFVKLLYHVEMLKLEALQVYNYLLNQSLPVDGLG